MSEAIYLGKPIYTIPVKKQFEQLVNAIYMKKLGYGVFHEQITKESFEEFLSNLDFYSNALSSFKHDHNEKILLDLDKTISKYCKRYKNDSDYSLVDIPILNGRTE